MTRTKEIRVEGVGEFRSVDALRQHVQGLPSLRHGMVPPSDLNLLRAYAEHVPLDPADPLDGKVRRVLEGVTFIHTDPDPYASLPTPFDERIEEAAAALEVATAKLREAEEARNDTRLRVLRQKRELIHGARSKPELILAEDQARLLDPVVEEADHAFLVADDAWLRAKARHGALLLAAGRWRAQESARRGAV